MVVQHLGLLTDFWNKLYPTDQAPKKYKLDNFVWNLYRVIRSLTKAIKPTYVCKEYIGSLTDLSRPTDQKEPFKICLKPTQGRLTVLSLWRSAYMAQLGGSHCWSHRRVPMLSSSIRLSASHCSVRTLELSSDANRVQSGRACAL